MYADKATLLRALTQLHEQTIDDAFTRQLFGGAVLIREITARQRQDANEAAQAQDPEKPDNALYRAMLIQQAVVDPESGQPYADSRRGPDGAILIDPRTRTPLFTLADVVLISDGRDIATNELTTRIASLAALGPQAMFSGDPAPDSGERDQGPGAEAPGDAPPGDVPPGTGDADGGAAYADGPVAGDGPDA
jgi:hypothetical protein